MEEKRLFIGGLFHGITEADVKERFARFGTVTSVEIREKKTLTGEPEKTFAYINLNTDHLQKCMSTFNNTKWKGNTLRVQQAKECFLDKLKTERSSSTEPKPEPVKVEEPSTDIAFKTFKAKPGTETGEKNWVVDKFGKTVPVVFIRKKDKRKIMKVDPTSFTKSLKKFPDKSHQVEHSEDLTWQLPEKDDVESRKKRGVFPKEKKKKKAANIETKNVASSEINVSKVREEWFDNNKADDIAVVPAKLGMATNKLFNSLREKKQLQPGDGNESAGSADTDEILSKSRTQSCLEIENGSESILLDSSQNGVKPKIGTNVDLKRKKKTPKKITIKEAKTNPKVIKLDGQTEELQSSESVATAEELDQKPSSNVLNDPDSDDSSHETRSPKKKRKSQKSQIPQFGGTGTISDYSTDAVKSDFVSISDGKQKSELASKGIVESSEMPRTSEFGKVSAVEKVNVENHNNMDRFNSDSEDDFDENKSRNVVAIQKVTKSIENVKLSEENHVDLENRQQVETPTAVKTKAKEPETDKKKKIKKKGEKTPKGEKTAQQLKVDKKLSSDKKRVEAVKERQKEIKAQSDAIKYALSSVDSGSSKNKRVVFDSDSDEGQDDDGDDIRQEEHVQPQLSSTSKVETSKFVDSKSKVDLFDDNDSSDDSQSSDEGERFKIKPQFEGKKGQKLMYLQSRFQSDDRFKLTEHFKGSDSEDEDRTKDTDIADGNDTVGVMTTNSTTIDDDLTQEKQRSLDILTKLVGSSATKTKKKKKDASANFSDLNNVVHFDPSNVEHQKMEIQKEPVEKKPKASKKKTKETETVTEPEPMPEVSSEKYYEVATPLKGVFGQGDSDVKFSFLGGSDDEGQDGDGNDKVKDKVVGQSTAIDQLTGNVPMPWEQPFKYESSDEEEETNASIDQKDVPLNSDSKSGLPKTHKETFFFCENDARITEGLQFFRRHDTLENIREKWEEKRAELIEDYRNKHKKALRRNKAVISLKNKPYQRRQSRN